MLEERLVINDGAFTPVHVSTMEKAMKYSELRFTHTQLYLIKYKHI